MEIGTSVMVTSESSAFAAATGVVIKNRDHYFPILVRFDEVQPGGVETAGFRVGELEEF